MEIAELDQGEKYLKNVIKLLTEVVYRSVKFGHISPNALHSSTTKGPTELPCPTTDH